jgi:predicted DNA-binding transcriptional regulator AlpA
VSSEDDRLLTTAQLAERLQVPESTLRRWRMDGRGPTVTWLNPRRARYRPADVEAWLAAQQPPATSAG